MTPKPLIPGTYVLDIDGYRNGYELNALCVSLSSAANRARFLTDEEAYCSEFALNSEQQRALQQRDWTALMELGASIFHIYKLARVDNKSMQYLGGVFTGMSTEDFSEAMAAGGRHFG